MTKSHTTPEQPDLLSIETSEMSDVSTSHTTLDSLQLSPIETKIFGYLDECADAGKPVPTIRAIREAVGCSTNVISPVVKAWKSVHIDRTNKRAQEASERFISEATREAFASFEKLIAGDVQRLHEQHAQEVADARADFERRELELSALLETTSANLNAQLIRVGELTNEMKHLSDECERLKRERQEARRAEEVAQDKLERAQQRFKDEMSEAHREIKRLQAVIDNK